MKEHLLPILLICFSIATFSQSSSNDSLNSIEPLPAEVPGYRFNGEYENDSDWGYPYKTIYGLELFPDTADIYSLEEVVDRWPSGAHPNDGRPFDRESIYWAKFSMIGSDQFHGPHLFRVGETEPVAWSAITIYVPNEKGGFDQIETGSNIPQRRRFRKHFMNLFEINVPRNDTLALYFRLADMNRRFQESAPLFIHHIDQTVFWEEQPFLWLRKGALLSVFFLVFLYFFLFYLIEKDPAHLYFSLISLGLFVGWTVRGMMMLMPTLVDWWPVIFNLGYAIGVVAFLLFTRVYLNLSELEIRAGKFLSPLLLCFLAAACGHILIHLLFYSSDSTIHRWVVSLNEGIDIIIVLYVVYLGILSLRKGHRPAIFYLLTFFLPSFSIILLSIDLRYPVYSSISQGTLFTEIAYLSIPLFFALGLGYRSRVLQQQKEAAALAEQAASAKAAAAEDANEAKSNFLSMVSHELRTPLTSIIGFTKLNKKNLEEKIIPEIKEEATKAQKSAQKVISNLDVVESEGQRLTHLINELLDLAKIEAGKVEWKMTDVHPAELIERATAATDALFEQKPVLKLIKEIPENLPRITADRDRIIQVLINLISNAVKFTDSGTVTIGVRSLEVEKFRSLEEDAYEAVPSPGRGPSQLLNRADEVRPAKLLNFFVQDTGAGIPPEHLDRIFEKFKQVDDNQAGKPKGTGLGLPICKEIVEHHGGRIWVESRVGEGSIFYFSLAV